MQVIDYCKINCSLLLISVVKLQTKNNSQDYKIINRRFYTFKKNSTHLITVINLHFYISSFLCTNLLITINTSMERIAGNAINSKPRPGVFLPVTGL